MRKGDVDMKTLKSNLPRAAVCILIFTLVCGILYTGVITGISQLFSPDKADGSIIEVDGRKYGSSLLAQQFTDDAHMWGRIMNVDTGTFTDKNGNPVMYSGPSNLSPASLEYQELVARRVKKIRAAHPEKGDEAIPSDLVTCSGSGLDPEISLEAANYQVNRLAEENDMTEDQVQDIIEKCTNHRILGFLGEKTVNVLKVNLILDGIIK